MDHFDYVDNATITLTRTAGSRGASGYVAGSIQQVFSRRGDLQENGRTLQQLQATYDEGDVIVYVDIPSPAIPPPSPPTTAGRSKDLWSRSSPSTAHC